MKKNRLKVVASLIITFGVLFVLTAGCGSDEEKKAKRQEEIIEAHQAYLDRAASMLEKTALTLQLAERDERREVAIKIEEIQGFMAHAQRQIAQIERRVMNGESIPHEEKVFSIFQEHEFDLVCHLAAQAGVRYSLQNPFV